MTVKFESLGHSYRRYFFFSYHLSLANLDDAGNVWKLIVPCNLSMGKFVSVVKLVDVRGYMVCMLYVMYVGVRNSQENAVS